MSIKCFCFRISLVFTLLAFAPIGLSQSSQPSTPASNLIEPELKLLLDKADAKVDSLERLAYRHCDFILADAQVHIKAGDIAGARKLLRKLPKAADDISGTGATDHFIRAEYRIGAMELLVQVGDHDTIRQIIGQAKLSTDAMDSSHFQPRFMGRIAAIEKRIGSEDARKSLESALATPVAGSDAEVVEAFAKVGEIAEAVLIGQRISGRSGLERVVRIQAQQGDIAGAEKTMKLIEPYESGAMAAIAEAQFRQGNLEAALKTIRRKPLDKLSAEAQCMYAILLAKNGEFAAALEIAAGISQLRYQFEALVGISIQQSEKSEKAAAILTAQKAFEIASGLPDDSWMYRTKSPALGKVAVAFAKADAWNDANYCVTRARYSNLDRGDGRLELVTILADGGMVDQAKSVAEMVIDSAWIDQDKACKTIAKAMVVLGRRDDAEKMIAHFNSPELIAYGQLGLVEGLIERRAIKLTHGLPENSK